MLCSKCKRKVKIESSYLIDVKGKTKNYSKRVNLCNPCHQIDCKKSRNNLRDSFNAIFTVNGVDRSALDIATSGKEYD
jgi:hypothetical protein